MIQWPLAVGLSALVSLAAWRLRTLTVGGALAAFVVGLTILIGTGWPGGAALAAFFAGSSTVSRATESHQAAWVDARGNRRDPWQVAANGGMAAVGGLIGLSWPGLGLSVVICSLAAAAADTWATSVGALSPRDPMHVLRPVRVPRGTSGAVSLIGTLGGLAGAAVVGAGAVLAGAPRALVPMGLAIGMLGMMADSILGATLQGRFRCPRCQLQSERRRHRCGKETELTGGWRWLGNDGVNAIATVLAGAAGAVCWLLGSSP
jgi:uncharacterized protein (TIGR00297 family)